MPAAPCPPEATDIDIDAIARQPIVSAICTPKALAAYLGRHRTDQYHIRLVPPRESQLGTPQATFYCVVGPAKGGTVTGSLRDK